jgi:hypothetical protein
MFLEVSDELITILIEQAYGNTTAAQQDYDDNRDNESGIVPSGFYRRGRD